MFSRRIRSQRRAASGLRFGIAGLTASLIVAGSMPITASANSLPARPAGPSNSNAAQVVGRLGVGANPAGPATGFVQASTAINEEAAKIGSLLGSPSGELRRTPGGTYFQQYQFGTIYWTPVTGAHFVSGSILFKFALLGGPDGLMGPPMTDEGRTLNPNGRYQHFANGSIFANSAIFTANEIHGAIRDKYQGVGWEVGPLGFPTSDETTTAAGVHYNTFENGAIYWTPETGALEVHGSIYFRYAALGWERSYLGLPVSDERDWVGPSGQMGRISDFQYGKIGRTPDGGVVELPEVEKHHEVIDTAAFNAISSAWADVEVRSDGYYRFSGHYHDSGVDSYHMTVTAEVLPSDGSTAFVLQPDTGYVTPNHRDHDWPWPAATNCGCGHSQALRDNWKVIRGAERDGRIRVYHDYTSDLEGLWNKYKDDLGKIAMYVIKLVTGGSSDDGSGHTDGGENGSGQSDSGGSGQTDGAQLGVSPQLHLGSNNTSVSGTVKPAKPVAPVLDLGR